MHRAVSPSATISMGYGDGVSGSHPWVPIPRRCLPISQDPPLLRFLPLLRSIQTRVIRGHVHSLSLPGGGGVPGEIPTSPYPAPAGFLLRKGSLLTPCTPRSLDLPSSLAPTSWPLLPDGPSGRPSRRSLRPSRDDRTSRSVRPVRTSVPSDRSDHPFHPSVSAPRSGLETRPSGREKSITRARSRRFREQTEPGFHPFRVQPCRDVPGSGRVAPPSPPGTAAIVSLRSMSSKQAPCPGSPFMKSLSPTTGPLAGVDRVRRTLVGFPFPADRSSGPVCRRREQDPTRSGPGPMHHTAARLHGANSRHGFPSPPPPGGSSPARRQGSGCLSWDSSSPGPCPTDLLRGLFLPPRSVLPALSPDPRTRGSLPSPSRRRPFRPPPT